jgi:phytoene dehydrogenase-like protein
MKVWNGWATTSTSAAQATPTWDTWLAHQWRIVGNEQRRTVSACFGERELARLSFMRWLYQQGCLDPSLNDNA